MLLALVVRPAEGTEFVADALFDVKRNDCAIVAGMRDVIAWPVGADVRVLLLF